MRYRLVKIATSRNWYIQWFEQGHSRRASTGTTDDDAAADILSAFKIERTRHPTGPVTAAMMLDYYLETKGKDIASYQTAELAAKRLKRFLGTTLAVDCGPSAQQLYVDERRATVKDETIARELAVLSAALNHAARFEKIDKAPPILSLERSPPKDRWLTRKEVALLFWSLRGWRKAPAEGEEPGPEFDRKRCAHLLLFTRLALYTGARTSAILQLTWDRVDLERGEIAYAKVGARVRANKKRAVVPIDAITVRALRYAKAHKTCDHVISYAGKPVARIRRAFDRHVKALGIEGVTPHTLRHTFATWAARHGIPLFDIGGVLGQSLASTTERYAKHQTETKRRVVAAVRRK